MKKGKKQFFNLFSQKNHIKEVKIYMLNLKEQMSQERETIVEATIVKIMKARKQLPFSKLVEETQSDLKLFKI